MTVGLGGGSVSNNTAIGKGALTSATSNSPNNIAVGFQALNNITTGPRNTAVGYDALLNLEAGGDTTAIGSLALANSVMGSDQNTAVGSSAMGLNTTGSFNVALGASALLSNLTGQKNTALGFNSLLHNDSGGDNIAIGFRAGLRQADDSNLTSPEDSIYIGSEAKGFNNNDINSIVIGTAAAGAGANTTVIGNTAMTDVYFGSVAGNSNIHAKKLFLGSSATPGCIVMGDSDGSGVTYITVNDGALSASTAPPATCQ